MRRVSGCANDTNDGPLCECARQVCGGRRGGLAIRERMRCMMRVELCASLKVAATVVAEGVVPIIASHTTASRRFGGCVPSTGIGIHY
eukprot:7389555-Prymnesium_polylepis.1